MERFGGRQNWTMALPAIIKSLNESHANYSPLSRSSLFFSPLYYSNPALVLSGMQKNLLDRINLKRIENLANKGISKQLFQFKVGNFVLLQGDLPTEK